MNLKTLKNSSYILLAQGLVKVIAFFYTIFLARSLGVENFGLYIVALSYFVLISSLSDFGISRFLIKETTGNRNNLTNLLPNIIFFRLFGIFLIILLFILFAYFLDPVKNRASLSIIAAIAILPQAISLTVDNILIARQKFSISALVMVITSLTTTLTGYILITKGFGALGAVSSLLIGQFVYALALLGFSVKENIDFLKPIRVENLKKILLGSLPYGLLGLLGLLYFRIDAILLAYLKGPYDTGIYGAAYKFLEATVIIPAALSVVLFPQLVRLQGKKIQEIKTLTKKVIFYMAGLGLIITIGFILILPFFINAFLPKFASSIEVIRILSLAIPFMFIHIPLSQVLLSSDKYLKHLLMLSLAPLALNIALNLLFIPAWGYIASSWITVFSDVFSLLILYLVIRIYFFKDEHS